jgi:hypothetical protein
MGRDVSPSQVLGFNFQAQRDRFEEYLDAHCGRMMRVNDWSAPAIRSFYASTELPPPAAPEYMLKLAALMADFHMTETEALNTSLVKARWLTALLTEWKGAGQIVHMDAWRDDQAEANRVACEITRGMAKVDALRKAGKHKEADELEERVMSGEEVGNG